jgi:hypothetical protein
MRAPWSSAVVGLIAAFATACSEVQERRLGVEAPVDSELGFGPVGSYLAHRCGTLDCHGQTGRNLRVWGCDGMRLDPFDVPSCDRLTGGSPTTAGEHQATYRSLVGLEPSVMSAVVSGGGQHPELLTFIRKIRGTEAHKGGQLVTPGDDQDQCLSSWLASSTDDVACANATRYPVFPALDGSAE